MPTKSSAIDHGMVASPAFHKYLELLQGVIERMARNSSACKTWCVTLVTGALVFLASSEQADLAILCIVPIFMFLLLDVLYLALEQGFRKRYELILDRAVANDLAPEEMFKICIEGSAPVQRLEALKSFSIVGLYPIFTAIIFFVWIFTK